MPKTSIDKYLEWMKLTHGHDFLSTENRHRFDANIRTIHSTITNSPITRDLEHKLFDWAAEYEAKTKSSLFMQNPTLQFVIKPYKSVIDKSFRLNALWNNRFPDAPPKQGWITPENVFSTINDLVRTFLVCKFIDGPKFLTEKLASYCTIKGAKWDSYSQERDEGHYAYHFYIYFDVEVLDATWNSICTVVRAEIQLTTQLQDVLRNLTHQYFEVTRLAPKSLDHKWKWEVDSNRFRSAYMCHTLHLLEAIILDLRDKAMDKDSTQEGNGS